MAQGQNQSQNCKDCTEDISEIELHAEIEHLKRHLAERDAHIEAMETEFLKGNTRIAELESQVSTWREKYDRLYDSHRRVQRLNQNLEEKLLHMVDKCTEDKSQLARDVETLSVRLAESNYTIGHLHKENERYKNDMNLAIQLLQCKPDNFVSQKFDSLPPEIQTRVSSYIISKAKINQDSNQSLGSLHFAGKNMTSEKVNPDEYEFNISASLMSKILEESVQNSITSHCDTCTCLKKSINPFPHNENRYSIGTQTTFKFENFVTVCVNCNSNTNFSNSISNFKYNPPLTIEASENILQNTNADASQLNRSVLNDFSRPSHDHILVLANAKLNNEKLKLVSAKHKEIVTKIGDDLKDINVKDHYTLPSLEPMAGHHRLCDKTKTIITNSNNGYSSNRKIEDHDIMDKNIQKSVSQSSVPSKISISHSNIDVTFSQIENSVLIPNISPESKTDTAKPEYNTFNTKKIFHGSSISSNDAESKTSSNRSYNNSSYNGSNPKVHIGPGPRFCSLIMQAGSKNVLLDNAQPNIAPILYTRQTKHLENTISSSFNNESDIEAKNIGHSQVFSFLDTPINEKSSAIQHTTNNITLNTVDNLLDLPNEELVKDPLDLSEKPESGYKSNESAEIIDKLLFRSENIQENSADLNKVENDSQSTLMKDNDNKIDDLLHDLTDQNLLQINDNSKDLDIQPESTFIEEKILDDDVKVFNFDHYEKNLKHPFEAIIAKDSVFNVTNVSNIENLKIDTRSFINENNELFNENFDLKVASKNLSEINKKFQISSQVISGNLATDSQKIKDWKKETYTEKSSSSLSSDDSAAVLQKQQLIRVAEWVQKNLEMEQQTDFDNSDSCHQSVEEMHHVRNDFPRPAKIDHRIRKSSLKIGHKLSHHIPKHISSIKNIEIKDNNSNVQDLIHDKLEFKNDSKYLETHRTSEDIVNICGTSNDGNLNETHISSQSQKYYINNLDRENSNDGSSAVNSINSTKTYTKQELARMEYNVKQFLLNGTRWTKGLTDNYYLRTKRTGSKTETDL